MAYIDEITVGHISRFIDSEFTVKEFKYTTIEKALEDLPTNSKVEPLPTINKVIILAENKFYFWSVTDQILIDPKNYFQLGKQGSFYIDFDGNDDTVHFTNSGDLLDWSKSWTLGITYLGKELSQDSKYLTLFQNGQNRIMIRQGGANQGVYVSSKQSTYTWGANTWYKFSYGDKILCIYNKDTRQLQFKVNGTKNFNININSAETGAGEPSGKFSIGKSNADVGNYWPATDYKYFYGGLNNFIAMNGVMGDIAVQEYFELSSEAYTDNTGDVVAGDYMENQNFYSDLSSYIPMGESEYPNLVDKKGLLQGGIFTGAESGFKKIVIE